SFSLNPRWTFVTGTIRHLPDAPCLLEPNGPHPLYAYRALVPASGEHVLLFTGPGGGIELRLAAGIGARPPEHPVQLVPRQASLPVDSLPVIYVPREAGALWPQSSFSTDVQGVSIATPPCSGNPGWWTIALGGPLGVSWTVELPDSLGPCTRAMRTIVPYGSA